ncbi:MAG: bifunctional folylpolyglutamate synthase/dihydrofolate synthase, partial [Pseudobutyrivibrio sp.]|nr:bifunctional folylpolyglutamate synthase/dihydrofolate synthase [Pseudobutyrivibrio sp.]
VSEYEFLTVMAFIYFISKECEIVLMEVSMGGRMDTTNVIPAPLVTIITPISYDHMTILGNTLTEIATEKAGIIKPGTTVITASQEKEVALVLEETCKKNLVTLYSGIGSQFLSRSLNGQTFRVGERMYETSMLGIYQLQNAAVAIRAAEELVKLGYSISDDAIQNGIKNTKWFGRFTVVQDNPPIIVDGGHNRQGAAVLRQSLEAYFPGKKITFVLGILADKEVDIILDTLLPIADKCYTMAVPNPRTMDPEDLAVKIRSHGVEAVVLENGANISSVVDADSVICVCGSLYLLQNVIY